MTVSTTPRDVIDSLLYEGEGVAADDVLDSLDNAGFRVVPKPSGEATPAPGRSVRNILAVWRQTGPRQRERWRVEDRQLVEALEQLEGEVDALNNPEKLA